MCPPCRPYYPGSGPRCSVHAKQQSRQFELSQWGSPPFSRTLTRRPIKAMRSVHVKAQEVHCRVQAWRG
ncbi:hypothetical protein XcvCFBP7112P_00740 [Xanthomonas citri pv. vignicola]|nr:hypothetical protein XcvCFBP7112P_00740 [Xanthomonas citri pv. vignicola]